MTRSRPTATAPGPAGPAEPRLDPRRPSVSDPAAADPLVTALSALLQVESEARRAERQTDLLHLIANETRRLTRARQVFVLACPPGGSMTVRAASSVATVDRNAPLLIWVESMVRRIEAEAGASRPVEFELPGYADAGDATTTSYPFRHLSWVPFWMPRGGLRAGYLLAREIEWRESDRRIALRLAETFGHAWSLLLSRRPTLRFRLSSRWLLAAAATFVAACIFVPVQMTALAPVEVAAADAFAVSMPVDGIVASIDVEPNAPVKAGDPLLRLVDTVPRNKVAIAEREVEVARARLDKVASLAFSDARGRHELGMARAELELRQAELQFARAEYERTIVRAAGAGLAVFPDRRSLIGKPFATGDRLMQIADPSHLELHVDLPVADAVVLGPGSRVKAFLDSAPLHPIEGKVLHADYQARLSDERIAVYRVVARFDKTAYGLPRLGVRGTAQVYGPWTRLGIFLFRRPLASLRQSMGI